MATLVWACSFLWGFSFFIAADGFFINAAGQVCKDLDSAACKLMFNAKPDLCNDTSLANICRRFCGLCPIECYDCQQPVRDPSVCVQSSSCTANEICMLKEYVAVDGHEEYIMSCMKKSVCSLISHGFGTSILGKRDQLKLKEKRGILVTCCNTDYCNKPLMQTTPITAPTPTPTHQPFTTHRPMAAHITPPQTSSVPACYKDIAIALDSSSSIGTNNFRDLLNFIYQIIHSVQVGPVNTQIALETFSTGVYNQWNLNTYSTQKNMLDMVYKTQYIPGRTYIGSALDNIIDNVFTPTNGDRHGAPNIVIVITDGDSTYPDRTLSASTRLHEQGSDIIAVGIGSRINYKELQTIASTSSHLVYTSNFSKLPSIASRVVALMCQ